MKGHQVNIKKHVLTLDPSLWRLGDSLWLLEAPTREYVLTVGHDYLSVYLLFSSRESINHLKTRLLLLFRPARTKVISSSGTM